MTLEVEQVDAEVRLESSRERVELSVTSAWEKVGPIRGR